jgi:preprotein translocase subunit Sss1
MPLKIKLSIILTLLIFNLQAQKKYTPSVGSAERKAILDIIRKPTEKELGQTIKFTPSTFNIIGNNCFIFATIEQPNGKHPDLKLFKDKGLIMGEGEDAFFENNIQVVLKKTQGKWVIVKRVLGCTDVCWSDWYQELKLSKDLFDMK